VQLLKRFGRCGFAFRGTDMKLGCCVGRGLPNAESTMRGDSLRRMAEEMAALKRSSVTPDAKDFFAKRERECLDEAEEQERCPSEGGQPAASDPASSLN